MGMVIQNSKTCVSVSVSFATLPYQAWLRIQLPHGFRETMLEAKHDCLGTLKAQPFRMVSYQQGKVATQEGSNRFKPEVSSI